MTPFIPLALIVGFCAYIALVVAVLATTRRTGADPESLLVLTGKVLLVHAILLSVGLVLWLIMLYPSAGLSIGIIGVCIWFNTSRERRQLRALKMWEGRVTKLK